MTFPIWLIAFFFYRFLSDGVSVLMVPCGLFFSPQASSRSDFGDVDDRFGKGARGFLRQIVPDAARDGPVRIFAGELLGVGAGLRMRRAVGVAFHGDGGHGDD